MAPKEVDQKEEALSPRPSSLARKTRTLSEEALQVVTVSDVHSPRQEDMDENIEGGDVAIVERAEEEELEQVEENDDDAEEGDDDDDDDMEEERALKARCEAFVEAKRDEWLNKVLERRAQPAPLEDFEDDAVALTVDKSGGDDVAEQQESQGATGHLPVPQEIDTSGLATNPRLRNFLAGDGAVYAQQGLDNFLSDRASPPASPAAAFTGNLPPGWEMAFTPRGGTPYFYNEKTGVL